ncbi:competence protein ComJ [Xenorhabdus sp. XENO-1]|uniref:competence protein ComJ n=1 Tax=Xenorhabdus bovienii TaxID=40576 RepID=UPI0020CA8692|nr:competence protein ComJ [Xenorhabdus bovienii]MCP9266872.1 competence protein ComJ [Xenorhabdus bovienii subsp. africana]
MNSNGQIVDLLISHSQIQVRSRPFDEILCQWGDENIKQGATFHKDYVVFDPLPDDTFGANIHLTLEEIFNIDHLVQRCMVVPFYVTDKNKLEIASATEKFKIDLDLKEILYSLYYEICEGDEVFYKLTFIPSEIKVNAKYMLDAPWGGEKNKPLQDG